MKDSLLELLHKAKSCLLGTLLAASFLSTAQATLSVSESSESVTIHVGNGSYVSYLAFVEPSLNAKPVIYAWHYPQSTNPDGSPRTGYDLFNAVAEETSGTPWALSYTTGAFGLTTSFQIGSTASRTVNPLTSPVWTYWIQGGSEFVAWGDLDSFTFSVGESLIISPDYWYTRYISDGSYDVWTIAPFSFTSAASDTHYYIDTQGKIQPVTFGTYEGTAPVLRRSPGIFSHSILAGGQLEIIFSLVEGGTYQLQGQDGLSSSNWQNLEAPFVATTTQKTYTLPTQSPGGRGFYRLVRKE